MSKFWKFAAGLAGACAFSVATGASAATSVVGAVRIEITSAVPDVLQIFDVKALELGSLDNVASAAEGASANAFSSGYSTSPDDAIDAFDGSPYFSAGGDSSEMLTIVLARTATLSNLSIKGRDNCCRDRDFWNVSIFGAGNALLFSGQLDARETEGSIARVDFDAPVAGVPEPATWAMLIVGFGAAGGAIRSRRRQMASA
ncbi:MAG: PEP-CTERM sorting domain-containing protein [Phenylobacterium sp.]|uniref:PEPxxWA-CTERM sorting domain-containing protein n=1 Tax=Phenylobacterium sp. TaxID=1871053 RepID=UPI0025F4FA9C|nr:PEPxxWA-CTERM sorting domain-containing protein [Phenylobacterium sp.]MBI1197169.1 PEP-CTERM sorting domain-containing protein [Phenylobacterium sp.]